MAAAASTDSGRSWLRPDRPRLTGERTRRQSRLERSCARIRDPHAGVNPSLRWVVARRRRSKTSDICVAAYRQNQFSRRGCAGCYRNGGSPKTADTIEPNGRSCSRNPAHVIEKVLTSAHISLPTYAELIPSNLGEVMDCRTLATCGWTLARLLGAAEPQGFPRQRSSEHLFIGRERPFPGHDVPHDEAAAGFGVHEPPKTIRYQRVVDGKIEGKSGAAQKPFFEIFNPDA